MSLLFWECVRRRFFTWMRKEIFFCIIQMIGDLFGISEFPVFGKEISPTQNTPHNQFSLEENDCIKFNRSFYDGIWSLETNHRATSLLLLGIPTTHEALLKFLRSILQKLYYPSLVLCHAFTLHTQNTKSFYHNLLCEGCGGWYGQNTQTMQHWTWKLLQVIFDCRF